MAIKVNLLPPEYTTTKGLARFLKAAQGLGVISIAFFLVFTLGISGFYIISSITLRSLNSDIDSLKNQISAQETSEQQIVLLKDRLSKIKTVLALPSSIENFKAATPYISSLSPTTSLSEATIDSQKIDMTLIVRSNADLVSLLQKFSGGNEFASVAMTNFTFSPSGGYLVGIRASKK